MTSYRIRGIIAFVSLCPLLTSADLLRFTNEVEIPSTEAASADTKTTSVNASGSVSINMDAVGFSASFFVFGIILLLYGVHGYLRITKFGALLGSATRVSEDNLTQTGYRCSAFGTMLKVLSICFALWLQLAMALAVVGHYAGVWLFDLSLPYGAVDWDSYTRVFLSAWVSCILLVIACRVFKDSLMVFFLMPESLEKAVFVHMEQVLVDPSDPDGRMAVKQVALLRVERQAATRHVDFLLRRYIWSKLENKFVLGNFFGRDGPKGFQLEAVYRTGGVSSSAYMDRLNKFGSNELIMEIPSLTIMIAIELSSFFYIYQLSICWLPLFWDYMTVGMLTFLLICGSAGVKIYKDRIEKKQLRNMATLIGEVWIKRDGEWAKRRSQEITVGDVVCLTTSMDTTAVLADCVLMNGTCVTDESTLTGECMPVQKYPHTCKSDLVLSCQEAENKKYFLFAGTTVLQATGANSTELPFGVSDGAVAVVTNIGANTLRGDLVRGLYFGAPLKSNFERELYIAIAIMGVVAVIDFFVLSTKYHMSMSSILTAMYSMVGLINPLMSVALLAGEFKSAGRLKSSSPQVFTRDVHRLTIAGKANLVLLDKTGTITKSGLDFYGVVERGSSTVIRCDSADSIIPPRFPENLSVALACAHAVSSCNNELIGHQVELKMVEAAKNLGWRIDVDNHSATDSRGKTWVVEKAFPFSHETMTMSVVVSDTSSNPARKKVICKGSFEALEKICKNVTPQDIERQDSFARSGCYVIGVSVKDITDLSVATLDREAIESELSYQGLILLKNEVKTDSFSCIREIQQAGIACAMLTGDSVYTGATVAKQVGIIDVSQVAVVGTISAISRSMEWRILETNELLDDKSFYKNDISLCISGEAYEYLRAKNKLDLDRTKVFGRVSPGQKAELVRLYSNNEKVVVMCGDGGNDSGALRAAHAGLALNGKVADATVAAPFNTNSESLSALTLLIRESRSALCTSLASYRTLVVIGLLYCINKSVLLMQAGAFFSGLAYLYLDVITTPLILFAICHALPAKKLASRIPEGSLIGPEMTMAIVWTILVDVSFLAIADGIMLNSWWYVPFTTDVPLYVWQERGNNFESGLLFLWCAWVYVDAGIVYSYGALHRRSIHTNWRLIVIAGCLFAMVIALMFSPSGVFTCSFKVNCSAADQLEATDSFINNFLFYYEKVGGPWYGNVPSTEFPFSFKLSLFFIFVSMSIVHHLGYKFIVTGPFVTNFLTRKWKFLKSTSAGTQRLKMSTHALKVQKHP